MNKRKSKNKNIMFIGTIVLMATLAMSLGACGQSTSVDTTASPTMPLAISVDEAASKRDEGAFILDVRTVEEWDERHIPASTLIPLHELPNRLDEVPGDMEIVVVCRSGNRSQSGRDILLQAGFEQVTSMSGGINEWTALGYPTEIGP